MNSKAEKLCQEAKVFLKRGNEASWAAAERMWRANKEEGATTREIGELVGKDQKTVSLWVRIWIAFSEVPGPQRPSFTEAYSEVRGGDPIGTLHTHTAKKIVAQATPSQVTEIVNAMPEEKLSSFQSAIVEKQVENSKKKMKQEGIPEPNYGGHKDVFKMGPHYRLLSARHEIAESLKEMQAMELSDQQLDILEKDVENIKEILGWVSDHIDTGASFDEQLAEILKEA